MKWVWFIFEQHASFCEEMQVSGEGSPWHWNIGAMLLLLFTLSHSLFVIPQLSTLIRKMFIEGEQCDSPAFVSLYQIITRLIV